MHGTLLAKCGTLDAGNGRDEEVEVPLCYGGCRTHEWNVDLHMDTQGPGCGITEMNKLDLLPKWQGTWIICQGRGRKGTHKKGATCAWSAVDMKWCAANTFDTWADGRGISERENGHTVSGMQWGRRATGQTETQCDPVK